MRINEILTEDQLDELTWQQAKNNARMTAAATALGVGALGSQMASHIYIPKSSTSVEKTQNVAGDFINKVEKEAKHKNLQNLEGQELKNEFVKIVLPMIKESNDKILEERKKLIRILSRKTFTTEEVSYLNSLCEKYKVKDNDYKELLKRVDVIPVGLTLSQAALESGFGKSRIAQQANALFGQKTTSNNSIKSQTDAYATFNDFDASIESYMRNLNTHDAYDEFREQRANMRKHGKELDPKTLTATLLSYSTKGQKYTKQVKYIMTSNNYDKIS